VWCFEAKFQGDGKNSWKLEGLALSSSKKNEGLTLYAYATTFLGTSTRLRARNVLWWGSSY